MATTAPLGKMVIELGLDSTDFGKSLQASKREVRTWSKDMSANMRAADIAGDKVGKLEARHNGLTSTITAQQKVVDSLRKSYDNSFVDGEATAQTEKLAGQVRSAESQLISYNKQLINNAGDLAKLRVETEGVTGALNKFGNFSSKVGKQMTSVGDSMTKGVTLPIVAGIGAVTKAAIDFEDGLVQMRKTIDVNDDVFDGLTEGVRELALEVPVAANELAEIAAMGGQLAVLPENLLPFTETVAALGVATNMTSDEAATMFAQFANITNMPQTEFEELASSVVKIGNNSATTERDVANMMMQIAGAGETVGMTQAEIVGLSGGLSSLGISAERGGSSISKLIIDMASAVSDGGERLEEFANVANLSAEEFSVAFGDNAVDAIGLFIDGLSDTGDESQSTIDILNDLGITEIRLRDTLLRASNAQGLLNESVQMSNEAWEENTELQREADIYYESTTNQMQMLRNEATDVAIELGGPFVQALRDGLDSARPLIESMGDLARQFSEADPETQQMIIRMLGFAAAAGPVLSITGRLATGIGGMTTRTIEFLGQMAKTSTVNQMTDALKTGTTVTGNFSGAAATAAGGKGVGAMTGAMGAFSSVAWPIVGVGGVLAVGYGAWKLWGEEAWNSAQRTKEWGTDVGEVTHEALTDMQTLTNEASGQFNLMTQGLDTNTTQMSGSFADLGESIEENLIRRIEAFDEILTSLPENFSETVREMVEEEKGATESALETVQANNERIMEMREQASEHNREISAAEAKIMQNLSQESLQAYVETLDLSASEQQGILDAMTGDVESASKDQAKAWVQALGEQRLAAQNNLQLTRQDQEEVLRELGYNLEGEFAQSYLAAWDEINQVTIDGFDNQIATIVEKYPELAEEVSLATGDVISSNDRMAEAWVGTNQKILDNAQSMTEQMAENAEENAEQISWVADEGLRGEETWNSLDFHSHEGEVETNAREEIIEASESAEGWNDISLQLHNADLNSNAKSIIGEAAIVNGWWDGLAWDDKELALQDEFSISIYEALEQSGKWNEMELEEQTAIMYSNTPEKMTETLAYLGLWEEFEVDIKEVNADNYHFMASIVDSEEKLAIWNELDPDTKELLAENYDLMGAIFESEEHLNRFNELPDEEKLILGDNTDLMIAVLDSEEQYNRWMGLPEREKKLIGDNTDILSTILTSEEEYNRWLNLPLEEKDLLGNNTDVISKILSSEEEYNRWRGLSEFEKYLHVNNSNAIKPTNDALGTLENYRSFSPGGPKSLMVNTNANTTRSYLNNAREAWNRISSGTKTLTTRYRTTGNAPPGVGPYATYAKGTNYHKGGPAIVNDQVGSRFREMVSFPTGESFIPQGRNVFMDLPTGAKVFKASLTEKMFPGIPQYANGVGIPSDATVIQNINRANNATNNSQPVVVNNDNSQLEALLTRLINIMSRLQPQIDINVESLGDMDLRELSQHLEFLTQVEERGNLQ